MERRGVYRKGRQGHAYNSSPYTMFRKIMGKSFNKSRWPLTALLVFALVFGMTPNVGDQMQASLLTTGQVESIANVSPDEGRKIVASALKDFTDECAKFYMDDCVTKGNSLMNEVLRADNDVQTGVYLVEDFAANFERDMAQASCKVDLRNAYVDLNNASAAAESFLAKYGDVVDSKTLEENLQKMNESAGSLEEFVDFCSTR